MTTPDERQPLIADRLQRAAETLADARLLLQHNGSPFSVINRSYYAMFYAVQALLVQSGTAVSKHSGVIAAFDRQYVKTGIFDKALSRVLHRAFDFRQIGDYREMFEVTQQQADEILRDAEQFVQTIAVYFGDLSADSSEQP